MKPAIIVMSVLAAVGCSAWLGRIGWHLRCLFGEPALYLTYFRLHLLQCRLRLSLHLIVRSGECVKAQYDAIHFCCQVCDFLLRCLCFHSVDVRRPNDKLTP